MKSESYPLLLLLALAANAGDAKVAHANPYAVGSRLPIEAPVTMLDQLQQAVQGRFPTIDGPNGEGSNVGDVRRQLAQWYNFPNFFNQPCIRGYWRNC